MSPRVFDAAAASSAAGSDTVSVSPGQVSLGVLAVTVPWFKVADAVDACGKREKRSDAKLPALVTTYLTMGLCLFADDPYEEVVTKVTGSLNAWGQWNASWERPSASAVTQARKRLGADVMRQVFERVAGPVAGMETRGAWLGRYRLMAIDGFEVDVPDTKENAAEFGYAGSGANRSAFPKARVVAVAECGTHAFVDAEITPVSTGEKTAAAPLMSRLGSDWLLTADRGFYSFDAWTSARRTEADLLWRAPTQLRLPVLRVLDDGSYLSVLVNPRYREKRRDAVLAAATAGATLEPEDGHLVRVVEYDVPDRDGKELIALLTTVLEPAQAPADALASAYFQRWEEETGNDQLKTHLRGPGRVLRSRLPDLAYQELWAYLLVHHAISALISKAATAADIDPDRVSYTKALRLSRRSASGTAAFPP